MILLFFNNYFLAEKKYSLVLEYADSGTLKTYLDEHFNELEWDDRLLLALQLAGATLCLHESDIIYNLFLIRLILISMMKYKL